MNKFDKNDIANIFEEICKGDPNFMGVINRSKRSNNQGKVLILFKLIRMSIEDNN